MGTLAAVAAAPAAISEAAAGRTDAIKLLSFNIREGGIQFGPLGQTAKLIGESGADFVGVQEIQKSGPQLAKLTGLHLFDQGGKSPCILSRWPLAKASALKWGARYDVPEHGPLWIFNAHFASTPYQPYQLAQIPYHNKGPFISTAAEAIAEALRARGMQVSRLLMDMGPAIAAGEPIVLTVDFNEPSHLDWTERAAQAGRCKLPVAWPTSRAITDAGLTDAYRAVYADEVKHPGHTWTPRPRKPDVFDRIDIIYTRKLRSTAAVVVGESKDNADVVVDPYPSDHRAVLVTATFK